MKLSTCKKIYPTSSQPTRFYGLPKLRKKRDAGAPPHFRPTVSSIGAYNYNLSKYLASILGPYILDKHTTQDSFSFVNEFTNIQSQNQFLISFDVESLFTNTPLSETIDLAVETIFKHNPEFPISKDNLRELFTFAASQTHFLFNGLFYDQCDGVAMGSPLAPILANLFMGYHEEQWIGNYKDSQLLCYRRYVDDTFCLFHNEQDAMKFLSYLNSGHPNIRFTFETQLNGKLPFQDVQVDYSGASCITSIYHKSTYTGLLTNFLSFTCSKYHTWNK